MTGSRPTLALVNAAPDFHKSGPMPSMRPTSWGSARTRRARTARDAVEVVGVSLSTLPAGTTEGGGVESEGRVSCGAAITLLTPLTDYVTIAVFMLVASMTSMGNTG